MVAGLDDLIDHLLQDVALSGSLGLDAKQLERSVREFYQSPNPAARSVQQQDSTDSTADHDDLLFSETPPTSLPIVDDELIDAVWDWLSSDPEVEVRTVQDNDENNDRSVGAESQTIIDTTNVGQERPRYVNKRLFALEVSAWQAIAGHEVDHQRLPSLEFQCLSAIAAHGPAGVLQPEITKITGQDKRSVPKRTDKLAEKGYITKESVLACGTKTSLLKLKRFVSSIKTSGVILYDRSFSETIRLLKAQPNWVIAYKDLRIGLGVEGILWETRALNRCIRRLAKSGCVQKVTVRQDQDFEGDEDDEKTDSVRSILLVREPTDLDRVAWEKAGRIQRRDRTGTEADAESGNNIDAFVASDDEAGLEADETDDLDLLDRRSPPQWTPDLPYTNLIFNIVDSAGTQGMSSMQLIAQAMGNLWRRPMDEMLGKLTDIWQASQPAHLRHLGLIRDTAINNKSAHYLYRTFDNFEKAVKEGKTAWEAVRKEGLKKTTTNCGHQKTDHGTAAPPVELDFWEFPKLQAKRFAGTGGRATLAECMDHSMIYHATTGVDISYLESEHILQSDESPPRKTKRTKGRWNRRGKAKARPARQPGGESGFKPIRKHRATAANEKRDFAKFARSTAQNLAKMELIASAKGTVIEEVRGERPSGSDKGGERSHVDSALATEKASAVGDGIISANRIAALEADILRKIRPGIYINPPGALNMKAEWFVQIGRPRKSLIAVVKSKKLKGEWSSQLPWFKEEQAKAAPPGKRAKALLAQETPGARMRSSTSPSVTLSSGLPKKRSGSNEAAVTERKRLRVEEQANEQVMREANGRSSTRSSRRSQLEDSQPLGSPSIIWTSTSFDLTHSGTTLLGNPHSEIGSAVSAAPNSAMTTCATPTSTAYTPVDVTPTKSAPSSSPWRKKRGRPSKADLLERKQLQERAVATQPKCIDRPRSSLIVKLRIPGSKLDEAQNHSTHAEAAPSYIPNNGKRAMTVEVSETSPPEDMHHRRVPVNDAGTADPEQSAPVVIPLDSSAGVATPREVSTLLEEIANESGVDKVVVGQPENVLPVNLGDNSIATKMQNNEVVEMRQDVSPSAHSITPLPEMVIIRPYAKTASQTRVECSSPVRSMESSISDTPPLKISRPCYDSLEMVERGAQSVRETQDQAQAVGPTLSGIINSNPAVDRVEGPLRVPSDDDVQRTGEEGQDSAMIGMQQTPDQNQRGKDTTPLDEGLDRNDDPDDTVELDVLPDLRAESPIEKRASKFIQRKAGTTTSGGNVALRRMTIVMDIIQQCGGVYPGSREMWYPFVTVWEKTQDSRPDRKTVENVVQDLVDSGKLKKLSFSLQTKKGKVESRSIVMLPEFDADSKEVREVQRAILRYHPAFYLPAEADISSDLRSRAGNHPLTRGGSIGSAKRATEQGRFSSVAPPHYTRTEFPVMQGLTVKRTAAGLAQMEADAKSQGHENLKAKITEQRTSDNRIKKKESYYKKSGRRLLEDGTVVPDVRDHQTTAEIHPKATESVSQYAKAGTLPSRRFGTMANALPNPPPRKTGSNVLPSELLMAIGEEDRQYLSFEAMRFSCNPVDNVARAETEESTSDIPLEAVALIMRPCQTFYAVSGTMGTDSIFPTYVLPQATAATFPTERPATSFRHGPRPWGETLRHVTGGVPQRQTKQWPPSLIEIFESTKGIDGPGSGDDAYTRFIQELSSVMTWELEQSSNEGLHSENRGWIFINHTGPPGRFAIDLEEGESPYTLESAGRKELARTIPKWMQQNTFGKGDIVKSSSVLAFETMPRFDHDSTQSRSLAMDVRPASSSPFPPPLGHASSAQPTPSLPEPSTQGLASFYAEQHNHNEESTSHRLEKPHRHTFKSRKRKAPDDDDDVEVDTNTDGPLPVPSVKKPRNRKASVAFEEIERLTIARALIRLLCGGIEQKRMNWDLVAHALSFKWDGEFLRRRWMYYKRTCEDEAKNLQDAIREPFLAAYEKGQLPRIDFQNLAQTDWPKLFKWVEREIMPQRPVAKRNGAFDLPRTMELLEDRFALQKPPHLHEPKMDDYFTSDTDRFRRDVANKFIHGSTLPGEIRPGYEDVDDALLLKSWCRAVAMTKERSYNQRAAAAKISNLFSEAMIKKATDELLRDEIFIPLKKNRQLPGRNFNISVALLKQFKRWPGPSDFLYLRSVAAAWSRLTGILEREDCVTLGFHTHDPDIVVLTNMASQGLVRVTSMLPERNDDFDAPFPKLTAWGYADLNYRTKDIDKSRLRFPVVYEKTSTFTPHHGLTPTPIPMQPPPFPGEPARRLPLWVDIHGHLLDDAWDMVLRSVLHLVVFRPGATLPMLARFHRHKLWAWEIALVLAWMEAVGLAKRCGAGRCRADGHWTGGWRAGDWWYCAFTPDIATWSSPMA